MQTEYVLEEGQEHDFYYKGHWYVAYSRLYSNGDQDDIALGKNPKIGLVYHGTKNIENTDWNKVLELKRKAG